MVVFCNASKGAFCNRPEDRLPEGLRRSWTAASENPPGSAVPRVRPGRFPHPSLQQVRHQGADLAIGPLWRLSPLRHAATAFARPLPADRDRRRRGRRGSGSRRERGRRQRRLQAETRRGAGGGVRVRLPRSPSSLGPPAVAGAGARPPRSARGTGPLGRRRRGARRRRQGSAMTRVAVVTSATSAVAGFVVDRDLHRRIGIEVPLVVRTHPSMRLPDRLRDLAGSIDRRSRMTGRPRSRSPGRPPGRGRVFRLRPVGRCSSSRPTGIRPRPPRAAPSWREGGGRRVLESACQGPSTDPYRVPRRCTELLGPRTIPHPSRIHKDFRLPFRSRFRAKDAGREGDAGSGPGLRGLHPAPRWRTAWNVR